MIVSCIQVAFGLRLHNTQPDLDQVLHVALHVNELRGLAPAAIEQAIEAVIAVPDVINGEKSAVGSFNRLEY